MLDFDIEETSISKYFELGPGIEVLRYQSIVLRYRVTVARFRHLEPQFSVYALYIQRIFHIYAVLTDIHEIYVVYPWIYHGYPTEWIYVVYPWKYHVFTRYIRGISMDIHGISFDVYPWYIRGISMDIPRFLNPYFSACPYCYSLSKRTRLWVLKSVYSTAHCFFLPASGALPFAAPPACG
jgi:hypothetical protein